MKKHRIIKKRAARTTTAQAATAPNKGAKTKYNNSLVESQEPNYVEIMGFIYAACIMMTKNKLSYKEAFEFVKEEIVKRGLI